MYKCGNCGSLLQGTEETCPGCGKKVAFPKKAEPVVQAEDPALENGVVETNENVEVEKGESKFKANGFGELFAWILVGFVSLITLGFAFPAMYCWRLRSKAKKTTIDGKQLVFTGKAGQLFGRMWLWGFLTVITLTIMAWGWVPVQYRKWVDSNTHFEGYDEENDKSEFTGKAGGMIGVNIVSGLMCIVGFITLGWGFAWVRCYRQKWWRKHQTIDGKALTYDYPSGNLWGKLWLWYVVGILTLGILPILSIAWGEDWFVSRTTVE